MPMPYSVCRKSLKFQLQLGISSSWRLLSETIPTYLDYPNLSRLRSDPNSSQLRDISLPGSGNLPACDTSTGTIRPVVPTRLRRKMFDHLHSLSHPGIRATQHLLTSRYVWPGINKDVGRWAKTCIRCQRSKIQWHIVTPL